MRPGLIAAGRDSQIEKNWPIIKLQREEISDADETRHAVAERIKTDGI
jgi:hypothetical protein